MTRQKQAGFGMAVIITIIVVVLAVGGLITWRVYVANQKPSQNNSSQLAATTTIQNAASTSQSDPNAGYTVIKEWGMRFKPAEGLKDVVYVPLNATDGDIMSFSTSELTAADSDCDPKAGPLGRLSRMHTIPADIPPAFAATAVHLGDYYYLYYGAQAACSQKLNTAADNLQLQTGALFRESIKTLEAAK